MRKQCAGKLASGVAEVSGAAGLGHDNHTGGKWSLRSPTDPGGKNKAEKQDRQKRLLAVPHSVLQFTRHFTLYNNFVTQEAADDSLIGGVCVGARLYDTLIQGPR
jgi:hypothetical protein